MFLHVQLGGTIDRHTHRLLRGMGDTVCRKWRLPDEGIWEPRGGHVRGSIAKYEVTCEAIRDEIERRAWRPARGTYSAVFDADVFDATLLRMSTSGFANPRESRMFGTVEAVRRELGAEDGLPPGEGAFLICSFWLVEALALEGRMDEALEEFERLVGCANDLGLLSEEIDASSRELLGNFPQGFGHIGLINAAETLAECAGEPQKQPAMRTGFRAVNLPSILLWGFAATIVLTTTLSAGHHLRLTRLSMAFLIGTMFTPARDKALVIGFAVHFANGVVFALLYALVFEMLGASSWRVGAGIGALHGLFVLTCRDGAAARHAPAHGERILRPDPEPPPAAARLPGPELRPPYAVRRPLGAHDLRRDHRRLVPGGGVAAARAGPLTARRTAQPSVELFPRSRQMDRRSR